MPPESSGHRPEHCQGKERGLLDHKKKTPLTSNQISINLSGFRVSCSYFGEMETGRGQNQQPKQFGELLLMMITIEPEDPRSPEAQGLLSAFIEEVRKRYDEPPADVGYFDPNLVSVPKSVFLVVRSEGKAVGCGALIPMEDEMAEIKRMFVVPGERGHGIAKKILEELERFARDFEYDAIRLETGVKQPESIALYGKSGFYRVPNFPPFENDETAVCFEKRV